MAGRVLWWRLAEVDLMEAYIYIGADSPAAAERLVDAVGNTVAFLLENPGAGRVREFSSASLRRVRSWSVEGFQNYLLFYRVAGENLEVIRILHGARDIPSLMEDDGWPDWRR
jgi:toxin ParE1/3/4